MNNANEYLQGVRPDIPDTDGDGLSDYAEVFIYKTDPLVTNTLNTSTGYTIEQTGYEWIDISQTGQVITNFNSPDDGSSQISLGMQFPFSDATYNTAYVCNNGFISFGEESTAYDNQSLPSTEIPEKTLCVFWDDFNMRRDINSGVYIQTISNLCIISFEKMPFWGYGLTNRLSFQVVLHDDGRILYQYKEFSDDGSLPTIGMQWGEGSVEFYAGNVTNGTALLISNGQDADNDLDGVSDAWERKWFGGLDVVTNGSDFVTGDHLFTYAESAYLGLNPNVTDTDGDELSDKYEVEHGTDPLVMQDADGDGMSDQFEITHGLNPADPADALADPDGDGFPNVYEYRHGSSLFDSNSVPSPDRYVSLAGQPIAPFTNSATAAANIQAALVAAAPYDIIQVADGTYTGPENRNLNFMGKPLMLLSENGPENCVLDCQNAGRAFYFENNPGSVVRGVQIFQGFSDWGNNPGDGLGGAVYCENTRMLSENCWFRSNSADAEGGAVYGMDSSLVIKNCTFEDNGDEGLLGGACYFEGSDINMTGCTETGSQGDVGVIFYESDFTVQNCVFSNNACCALDGQDATGQIKNSTFLNNQDDYYNGGAHFWAADIVLSNCVFSGNSGNYGGALFCRMGTSLKAVNCLFSGNSSGNGAAYLQDGSAWFQNCTFFSNQCAAVYGDDSSEIILRNTILWGNESGSYNSGATGLDIEFSCLPEITGTNNIHIDPRLVTETGALLPNSPCVDRGSDLTATATDMLGTPRWDHPWRSNRVDSSIADIGAFEFTDSDTDADGLGDLWEIYYFTNITFSSGSEYFDTDDLSTSDEYRLNTNPWLADTDGDGLSDSAEVSLYGSDPLNADCDNDGLLDGAEIVAGTNPLLADSDADGLPDGWEIANGLNPLSGSDAIIDSDNDGLTNLQEYTLGTNPQVADTDGDGLNDYAEINTCHTNPLNGDTDGDGLTDGAEINTYGTNPLNADSDSDGLSDGDEINLYGTNPLLADSDNDGLSDSWELANGLNPLLSSDASADADGDGLTNLEEYMLGTDFRNSDTDGDGMNDYLETTIYPFLNPLNPTDFDYDHDGLNNLDEHNRGTAPDKWDTDGDTIPDGCEVAWGTNPLWPDDLGSDSDGDGLVLSDEYCYGTNPSVGDSDGDGVGDGAEVGQGSDPNNAADGGAAPDPDDLAEVKLTVGDESDSHSEIYELTLSGERTVRLNSGGYGQLRTQTFQLPKGKSYTVTLAHVGTSPAQLSEYGQPDYDYTAQVEATPGSPGIVIADASGMLGRHGDGRETTSPFYAAWRSATVRASEVPVYRTGAESVCLQCLDRSAVAHANPPVHHSARW